MNANADRQLIRPGIDRFLLAGVCFVFGALAIFSPVWPGNNIEPHLGGLLVWAGVLELYDGFRRSEISSKKSARRSAAFSLLMGVLLVNTILFQPQALYIFVTILFGTDAVRYFLKFIREYRSRTFHWLDFVAGVGNLLLPLILLSDAEKVQDWALGSAVSLRMIAIGVNLLAAKTGLVEQVDVNVVASLGLSGNPYVENLAERLRREQEQSALYDRSTILVFIILLFFIHLGRMGFDRSMFGILSPLVATFGDMVIALVITYVVIAPTRYILLNLARNRAQQLWKWIGEVEEQKRKRFSLRNLAALWLTVRMRAEIRFAKVGYSLPVAVRTGLKLGLPWSAFLAAIMPVLGMSWYFDTENWASGIWDNWAASRTDEWRMAITRPAGEKFDANSFQLHPQGVNAHDDFSFVVIGDPGEGDASQLVLKDQLLEVSNHPNVKYVVISSDVVYPTGALRDYEKKFWMPFKGIKKPVYAIPGNHDWYDALDGFVATFFDPTEAKIALTSRTRADHNISSTTERGIDDMIARSDAWRKEYEVPTGFQKAPYFQINAGDFVFLTLETGVVRQIDSLQRKWLVNVLEASKGKFVMVVLGHPFYAIGEYQGKLNPNFDSLHDLLRKYQVPLVMAGDTHDLEYYLEPPINKETRTMHHFVNGGGGAYLSIGAAMAKPGSMPTSEFAFYPSREPLVRKITDNTAWYKSPAWWWARQLDGWPFSAEWLSAMFDYNVSPYFQSFMEIRVEHSRKRVTLIPYSNHGRIKWRDMTSTKGARPESASMDDFAEWVIPME
jgi:uncharacterized membrane protein HdeD (DUF308 family)